MTEAVYIRDPIRRIEVVPDFNPVPSAPDFAPWDPVEEPDYEPAEEPVETPA
jgi:hypothetical protein